MKDWLISGNSDTGFWLTRIEGSADHPNDYLCGLCGGPLVNHVVAFFASSKGSPGTVACSICQYCDLLLGDHEMPECELDTQIELLLASAPSAHIA